MEKNLFKKNTYKEFRELRHSLNSENYDLVIDLQGLIRTGLLCRSLNSYGFDKSSLKKNLQAIFIKNIWCGKESPCN